MRALIFIISAVTFYSCGANKNSVGVVDLPSLYSSFDYQKELNSEFEKMKENVNLTKDSLTRSIQSFEKSLLSSEDYSEADKNIYFERTYTEYLNEQNYLDYQLDSIANDFSAKVWKQLNSYLAEYGEENEYDVIIGMQGNGNVMYAKEGVNITEDVITYANSKYNGN